MHIRSRLQHHRLQISLVQTRRINGKVRQEHIATLGSVPPDMTAADRVAFWTKVHPRLNRLSDLLNPAILAKVLGELHAKVPMVAIGDTSLAAHKIGIAEHNANIWTAIWDNTLADMDGKRKLIAKFSAAVAQLEKLASDAAGYAEQDRAKVQRLKAGEDVDVGKALEVVDILKRKLAGPIEISGRQNGWPPWVRKPSRRSWLTPSPLSSAPGRPSLTGSTGAACGNSQSRAKSQRRETHRAPDPGLFRPTSKLFPTLFQALPSSVFYPLLILQPGRGLGSLEASSPVRRDADRRWGRPHVAGLRCR
jgi:hypothetical protein